MNRKGSDLPSFLFLIVIIVAIGMTIFMFSHFFYQFYTGLSSFLDENPDIAGSTANETLTKVIKYEDQAIWDYFFLAIVIGYVIAMMILAFQTPSNPVFFFIFAILGMIGLFVGVAMSNLWEAMVENPEFATTLLRFPITDVILNYFYPLFVTMVLLLLIVMLFGKRFAGNLVGGVG